MKQLRLQLILVILVAFNLLFAGMRVPDISRPHRPKPSPRAVITANLKVAPDATKQHHVEFAALVPAPVKSVEPTFFGVSAGKAATSPRFILSVANFGRSPPAST